MSFTLIYIQLASASGIGISTLRSILSLEAATLGLSEQPTDQSIHTYFPALDSP